VAAARAVGAADVAAAAAAGAVPPAGRFVYDVPLRWSDVDAYGHVNNARFLTLYEEARVAMLFVAARATGHWSMEEGIVIARHEIDYCRPVDYGKGLGGLSKPPQVRIEMWLSELRAGSFTMAYELYDGAVLASRASSVCVPFNLTKQHPRRLSSAERDFLRPYLAPTPAITSKARAGRPDAAKPAAAARR
jgi:acyl-CoA thioester hydrolase